MSVHLHDSSCQRKELFRQITTIKSSIGSGVRFILSGSFRLCSDGELTSFKSFAIHHSMGDFFSLEKGQSHSQSSVFDSRRLLPSDFSHLPKLHISSDPKSDNYDKRKSSISLDTQSNRFSGEYSAWILNPTMVGTSKTSIRNVPSSGLVSFHSTEPWPFSVAA